MRVISLKKALVKRVEAREKTTKDLLGLLAYIRNPLTVKQNEDRKIMRLIANQLSIFIPLSLFMNGRLTQSMIIISLF